VGIALVRIAAGASTVSRDGRSQAGADSYEQFITYDGTTLKIAADSMLGDRLNVDIKVQ
jgi:hypothetical protein